MNDMERVQAQLLAMNPLTGYKSQNPETQTPENSDFEKSNAAIYDSNNSAVSELLQTALEGSAAPCILYDENDAIVFVNKAARAIWPDAIDEMRKGASLYDASLTQIYKDLPDFPAHEAEAMAKMAANAHRDELSRDIDTRDGRKLRLTHTVLDDGKVLGFGVDISSLRDREIELRAEKVKAETAKAAGSAFLAHMSHEIKTPLNAIVGMSDALLQEDICDETRETMEFILSAADGLNHVLGQTLDHAKIMADKIEIDLMADSPSEVVRSVCGMWEPQCRTKGLKLRIRTDTNVPETLYFDSYRYRQCLNNLLSNAIKFTESGTVTVGLKLIPGDRPRLALAVRDTGIGMSEEAQSRIFMEYEQAEKSTTRRFGGTGLGMSIVHSLTEAMDGQITVQSVPGEGTTFLLLIPAHAQMPVGVTADSPAPAVAETQAPAPVQAEQAAAAPAAVNPEPVASAPLKPETPFSGLNVLCVEDNPVNQAVVKKLIGRQVNSLTYADNGEIALKTLSLQEFDIVLMDIHMPVMNGIEATQAIRASAKPWANVCIIALTADPDFQYRRICRNIGMNDAIGKPVKRKDILDAIGRSLDVLKAEHAQKVALPQTSAA